MVKNIIINLVIGVIGQLVMVELVNPALSAKFANIPYEIIIFQGFLYMVIGVTMAIVTFRKKT